MDSFEKYFGDTYELVDTLKNSAQGFIAAVYDKRAKRLCTMKQRNLKSAPIYQLLKDSDNPYVPKIYRLFERDGKLIVVEEYIDGQTLEEILIYNSREINETLAEKILIQLCECLAVLHERNIIHRDLKPSNIMLTEKSCVKLIDFGIARIFKPENSLDTELLGTRGYAPPEQFGLFDFGQTDRRSDIYALGVTMKTLLGADYNGALKKILDKCTALEPSQRYQSVEKLRAAVIGIKKFQRLKKFFVAASISTAIFFFPQTVDFKDNLQPSEEIFSESEETFPASEVQTPVKENPPAKKTFDAVALQIPVTNFPEVNLSPPSLPESNLPTPLQLPEINSPPAQVQTSGEVEMKFYLNGELTGKEHMVYLDGWQSWARDEYGQILFPANWSGRLRIENYSGKDLINPKLEVNIGDAEKIFNIAPIANGQSFELEIPLGNKLASPEEGSGHLQIILHAEGVPRIFLNKTFFLIK